MVTPLNTSYSGTESEIEERGYAIIDFFDPGQTRAANQVYEHFEGQFHETFRNGIHMTTWLGNYTLKSEVCRQLEAIIGQVAPTVFENYKLLNTTFIAKRKHRVSNFPLHQDWSFVDELEYLPLNLWIALQDTGPRNGGLYVVEGSHRLNNVLRGAGRLTQRFDGLGPDIGRYLRPLRVRAGQAVLFPYSLVHGSGPNRTANTRIIAATSVVPGQAQILINHLNESTGALEQYAVDDQFIYRYNDIQRDSLKRPDTGRLCRTIENYRVPDIGIHDIEAVAAPVQTSIFRRFMHQLGISRINL